MKTRNIIAVLWVASILGGWVHSSSVGTVGADRVAPSNDRTVSKAATFLKSVVLTNGATLQNGVAFANGTIHDASRVLALTALASRPLAKRE